MARKKHEVHTTTFGNMDEPREDRDKSIKAMREKVSKLRKQQG